MDCWITGSLDSFKNWFIHGIKHHVAMHCCIKLIAHLCSRPRAHALIYRKVHSLCNEYKNVKTHTWVFFCCWNYRGILTGLHRAVNAFGLSRRVFIKKIIYYFSQSWIMSALLSSLSPSQSHIHYVRRMSLNSNQGKIIPSVGLFLKNFKICALTILREKWRNCFWLCAACYSTQFWLANRRYLVRKWS